MAAQVTIQIKDTLTPALRRLAKSVKDWRSFWPTAASVIYEGEAEIFRRNGPGWKPLSQVTTDRRRKGRGEGSAQILRDTRRLMASISGAGGSGGSTKKAPLELRIGTNIEYAASHQFGLEKRTGWVPAHTVKAHRVKAHTRLGRPIRAYMVREHAVRGYTTTLPAVPARPFMKFTEDIVGNLQKSASRWLERQFEQGASAGG